MPKLPLRALPFLLLASCARPALPAAAPSTGNDDSCESAPRARGAADASDTFPRAGGIARVERLTRARFVGRSEVRQTSGAAVHLAGDGRTSAEDLRRALACQSATVARAADDARNPLFVTGARTRVFEEETGFVVEVQGPSGPSAREIYSRASKLQPL